MRIWSLLLIFMLFNIAEGASISLLTSVEETTLGGTVSIHYEYSEAITGNIKLTANNLTFIDADITDILVKEDYIWKVGNTPAGSYEISFVVTPDGLSSQQASEVVKVAPQVAIDLTKQELPILAFSGETNNTLNITNAGNVEVNVRPQFIQTPASDVAISPTLFNLKVGESREILVSVVIPSSDYNFTLKFVGESPTDETLTDAENIFVRIYKPISDIKWNVTDFYEGADNSTMVSMELANNGNFEQTLLFILKTFSTEKTKLFQQNVTMGYNSIQKLNVTIPTADKIYQIELFYKDGLNQTVKEVKKFSVVFGISVPELAIKTFTFIFGNSTLRGMFLSALFVVILLAFFKFMKRIFRRRLR